MSGCEEFEIAIEKRLHGALDGAEAARLEEHLAACAACRDYAKRTRMTEEDMQTTVRAATDGMEWDRASERVLQMAAEHRRAVRRVLVGLAVVAPAAFLVPPAGLPVVAATGAALLAVGATLLISRSRFRDAERVAACRGDLVAFCRAELDRRLRDARQGVIVTAVFGGWGLASTVADLRAGWPAGTILLGAIGTLMFLGIAIWVRFRVRPRLERERAELD